MGDSRWKCKAQREASRISLQQNKHAPKLARIAIII